MEAAKAVALRGRRPQRTLCENSLSRAVAAVSGRQTHCKHAGGDEDIAATAGFSHRLGKDELTHATGLSSAALGRVTQVTFPSTRTASYTYDAMKNLLTKRERKGPTISHGHHALCRLTSERISVRRSVPYSAVLATINVLMFINAKVRKAGSAELGAVCLSPRFVT